MPLLSDDANAMGYLGLQTKNSNTLDKISASAKAALFDKFSYSGAADHTGSLYQFGSRDKLKEMIEKDLTSPTVAKINQYTDFIQAQTGLFNGVKNQIDKAATLTEKRDILLKGVSAEGPLTDTCFNGYNLNNSSSKALELVNPTGGNTHFIPDSSGSQTGSRITIMQINQYDVKGETNEQITENLQKTLGNDLFDYLVAQAALDPNNQTTTINDVIKTVFNGNKLAVYDRRFNDQLGSQ
jgi:hypothetical protein